jgi:hypothetical protein
LNDIDEFYYLTSGLSAELPFRVAPPGSKPDNQQKTEGLDAGDEDIVRV